VFENRVLRRILEPRREEVTGGWRKQLKEELRDLYSSPSKNYQAEEDSMGGECSLQGGKTNSYTFLAENRKERDH
jgi:hypothetical protein